MKILKGQRVLVKGQFNGRWKEYKASEDFDTADERFRLLDPDDEIKAFYPLSAYCEIKTIDEETGKAKLVKYKNDEQIWNVIKSQIDKSNIKRYSWETILGESLTKTILRFKMKGLNVHETNIAILEMPMVAKIIKFFPDQAPRLKEKIWISVCARYGENNTALNLYNKEFKE